MTLLRGNRAEKMADLAEKLDFVTFPKYLAGNISKKAKETIEEHGGLVCELKPPRLYPWRLPLYLILIPKENVIEIITYDCPEYYGERIDLKHGKLVVQPLSTLKVKNLPEVIAEEELLDFYEKFQNIFKLPSFSLFLAHEFSQVGKSPELEQSTVQGKTKTPKRAFFI